MLLGAVVVTHLITVPYIVPCHYYFSCSILSFGAFSQIDIDADDLQIRLQTM